MKRWMISLLALITGCATFTPRSQTVPEESILARSTGPDGTLAVWQDGDDVVLGYLDALDARRLCTLEQVKRRGMCPKWETEDFAAFQQKDVGTSWWVSTGGAPMVGWIDKGGLKPELQVVDFSTGATAKIPFVRKVWTRGERIHAANTRGSWVLTPMNERIAVNALLVPCAGERFCFEVAPRREGAFDDPLPATWEEAKVDYALPIGKIAADGVDHEFRMNVGRLGSVMVPTGATCRSKAGDDVLVCGAEDRTVVAFLDEGLPATAINRRGTVLAANGSYFFATGEDISSLEPRGELLVMGQPTPFHSGVVQLAGQCNPEVYEDVQSEVGQCLERNPINAVYATAEIKENGQVVVDAEPVDPIARHCLESVFQRVLAGRDCSGAVAFRHTGAGLASRP